MPASFHYKVMIAQTKLAWSHSFTFKCLYQAATVRGHLYVYMGIDIASVSTNLLLVLRTFVFISSC
jgi:hypothetical protein